MIVRPLGITQPLWSNFISICKEVMGIDPVAGLDGSNMYQDKVSSFMACLDLENDPRHALRTLSGAEHVSALFIVVVEPESVVELINLNLQTTILSSNCLILSGTMQDWHYAVVRGCNDKIDREARKVCNHIYTYLKNEGFYLWEDYETINNLDGSFIMRRHNG